MQFGSGYSAMGAKHGASYASIAPTPSSGGGSAAPGYFSDGWANIPGEDAITPVNKDPEASSIRVSELGQSVTEGSRFGSLLVTAGQAIRAGVGHIELAPIMGGTGEPGGAESYGREARQALRELAQVNNINWTTVHTPTQIGNMSGFNPQQGSFNDEYRHVELEEVKRNIDFAADLGGAGVVIHTGEYQRDMSDAPWNKKLPGTDTQMFLSYSEEPGRGVKYMVDDRTGKLITEVRKSQIIFEPDFETKFDHEQGRERWVDQQGEFIDEDNISELFKRIPKWDQEGIRFKTKKMTWDDYVERAKIWNKQYPKEDGKEWLPEELFFKAQIENQILSAKGSSLFYGRDYGEWAESREKLKEALEHYKKIENTVPLEEQWKMLEEDVGQYQRAGMASKFIPKDRKLPTQFIQEQIEDIERHMRFVHEASASADARADDLKETLDHVKPVEEYAKNQTWNSYAEMGIYAWDRTKNNPNSKKETYLAPENIWPEMGWGSHPQELIELVQGSRKRMVEFMTSPTLDDPHGRRDHDGNLIQVSNPHYDGSISKNQAEQIAHKHIKATFDVQHMYMWWKHFQPLPGESKENRRDRFRKWYMEEFDKLKKADVIGHMHVVDSLGGAHHHLPAGQGDVPIREVLEDLKKSGFKGTMISEAWEEDSRFGQGRIIAESWRYLGSPFVGKGFGVGAPQGGATWGDVPQSYFGQGQNPYFIFGAYAPSNDWQLWTQVPME